MKKWPRALAHLLNLNFRANRKPSRKMENKYGDAIGYPFAPYCERLRSMKATTNTGANAEQRSFICPSHTQYA